MGSCYSIVKSNKIAVGDGTAASASIGGKANGSTVVDGFAAEANGTAVVDGIAAEANVAGVEDLAAEASGAAVAYDATTEDYGIQIEPSMPAVDDTAASANGMVIGGGIAAKGNGTTVADGFAAKSDGTAVGNGIAARANVAAVVDDAAEADGAAVVDGAAPEANGAAVVVDAAKASGTPVVHDVTTEANGFQPRWNLWNSFQVGMLKVLMYLRLSGVTQLVNNSNENIEFYTRTMGIDNLRFCLNAHQTKRINMRELSAFRGAHTAQVVVLKVGEKYVGTFIPQDFVTYRKFEFNQIDTEVPYCSDRVARWPRQGRH